MYGIKTLSNLRCLKQLDQILLFIRRSRNGNVAPLCLCETVHSHKQYTHLSQPFCPTTVRFILLPFSMFYLFFLNNTMTLCGRRYAITNKKKKFCFRNFFFLFRSSHNAFVASARRLLFVHFRCLIFCASLLSESFTK
jgi:hypothetical protein